MYQHIKQYQVLVKRNGRISNANASIFAFTLDDAEKTLFPYQIALNVIPQIDVAQPNGFTKEEMKMVKETQKLCIKIFKLQLLVLEFQF